MSTRESTRHLRLDQSRVARTVTATLAVLNTIAALGGAWGLASGVLDVGAVVRERLPFGSTVLAGTALALLVGLPNLVLALLFLRRHPAAGPASIAVGAGMVVWIVVELAFIRELSFFHPLYVVVGLVMMLAGLRLVRSR